MSDDDEVQIPQLVGLVARIPNVAASPPPEVNLLDLTLLGPVISVRPYCRNEHYWQVYFDTNEAIVRTCKEAGWPAPMPMRSLRRACTASTLSSTPR